MLCYLGRAFCRSSAECANTECPRNLTDQEMVNARTWWSGCQGEPPIDFADLKTEMCGYVPLD